MYYNKYDHVIIECDTILLYDFISLLIQTKICQSGHSLDKLLRPLVTLKSKDYGNEKVTSPNDKVVENPSFSLE